MPGVFVSQGMTIGVPENGLTLGLGEDGIPTGNLTIHVHFDVCPTWLELALQHLAAATARKVERVEAWSRGNEEQKASSLEREFEASMQAIMAAAIALDAFYAVVQPKTKVSGELKATWRKNRTARHIQVAEVLRMAFGLGGVGFDALRQDLEQIFRLRDLAVHPWGDLEAPILHPELDVGVEWRFAHFRQTNADAVVNAVIRIITQLVTSGRPKNGELGQYAATLRARLDRIGVAKKISDDNPTATDGGL